MEDLSHLSANSMWATSEHAGNTCSDQKDAMTAPGSPSEGIQPKDINRAEQVVMPPKKDRPTVTHASESSAPDSTWVHANGKAYNGPELSGGRAIDNYWTQV